MSVIVVGLVPIGLFLATSVAYAMGALRMAGKSTLVQRLSAVESLSNVDVLCLDKTGTITTNTLVLEDVHPFGMKEQTERRLAANPAECRATKDLNKAPLALLLPNAYTHGESHIG